jgi:hypothetical protein
MMRVDEDAGRQLLLLRLLYDEGVCQDCESRACVVRKG